MADLEHAIAALEANALATYAGVEIRLAELCSVRTRRSPSSATRSASTSPRRPPRHDRCR